MAKITEEQIAKVKAENPGVELHLLEADPWDEDIIVRVPPEAVWMKWETTTKPDGAAVRGAQRDLVNGCLVYPDPLGFLTICDRRPALLNEFSWGIRRIAGVLESVKSKKL